MGDDFDPFGDGTAVIEQRMLSVNEVFVYKVPPLRTASGHRAEDWGLANPLFTGLLRIFHADTRLRIALYTFKDTTTLMETDENLVPFCECPIEVKPKGDITPFVDAVIDSSRYFVIRAKDPNSDRTTMIGVGFREREVAFDFKNSLNEYVKYVDRMHIASEMAEKREKGVSNEEDNEADEVSFSLSLYTRVYVHCSRISMMITTSSGRRSFIALFHAEKNNLTPLV